MERKADGIGLRLKQERLRLGLSQREFGEIGGVEANSQGKYESGKRLPKSDYLAAVAVLGVDILFVLTGQPASAITSLSNAESVVLGNYRSLAEEDQASIARVILTISGLLTMPRPRTESVGHQHGIFPHRFLSELRK